MNEFVINLKQTQYKRFGNLVSKDRPMNEAIKKLIDAQQKRRSTSSCVQDPSMGDAPFANLPRPIKIEFPSCWVYNAN